MMRSKEEIAEQIKARFSSVRERAGILAQALRVRAEIAAARRRLRAACADLGEEVYQRLVGGQGGEWQEDAALQEFRVRIDGIKAEVRQRERALAAILEEHAAARRGADVPPDAADDATLGDDEPAPECPER